MGSSIELSNGDMNVFLKESAYMFRTIIGDFVITFKLFIIFVFAGDDERHLLLGNRG